MTLSQTSPQTDNTAQSLWLWTPPPTHPPILPNLLLLFLLQSWVDKSKLQESVYTKKQDNLPEMPTHPRVIEHSSQLVCVV